MNCNAPSPPASVASWFKVTNSAPFLESKDIKGSSPSAFSIINAFSLLSGISIEFFVALINCKPPSAALAVIVVATIVPGATAPIAVKSPAA